MNPPDPITRLNAALRGRYRIEREVGGGGMATVYLADDLKHERKVALKVLKPELAAVVGADRFLAEIKTTANLQHPHILPLFDSGEADSFLFYVMPYVEGETLRDRLEREKQLPVAEAVRIATEVADALQTAHEHGVIHRDIKPANILLSRGRPLVADFGIALAVGAAGGSRLTETGLSIGSPYYMSPEQATGDQHVGPPSDLYALAVVLYEMLTGDPPYIGSTAQAVLGKIIQGPPVSATAIRKSIPANADAAIRKALEKLPADRFTSAQDFARALADPGFRHGEVDLPGAAVGVGPWKGLTIAMTAATLVLAGALGWALLRPPPPGPVARYGLEFPPGQELVEDPASFALAPDGSFIVYVGPAEAGGRQLWVKLRDSPEAAALSGTTGAGAPSVSPDGNWIAFLAEGELRKIPRLGGSAITLARSVNTVSLVPPAWLDDGSLLFVDRGAGVRRVPPEGGAPEVFWTPPADRYVFSLAALPDSRGILFTLCDGFCFASQEIWSFDLRNGEARSIVAEAITPVLAPTGHLVYARLDGGLYAMPFDVRSLEATGPAAHVMANVKIANGALANFALARDGTLLVLQGASSTAGSQVEWVTRQGHGTPVDPDWTFDPGDSNRGLALSPDGSRLALRAQTAAGTDIWIKELPDGPLSRLTFDEGADRMPRWTPDGESVTFLSNRGGDFDVWVKRAGGTGAAELLLDYEQDLNQGFWSPDGEWLVLETAGTSDGRGSWDILALRPGVDSVPTPLLAEEYDELAPSLSPDSRWLAYMSLETGGTEVFVRPFPDVDGGKWQISTDEGISPLWAHSGRELFYITGDGEMVAAQIETTPSLRVTERRVLFRVDRTYTASYRRMYDVAPDDQRFLMVRSFQADTDPSRLILVENWAEELKKRAGN